MTFKMLIVDDEPIICRGLQLTVPWADYQIEVVDTAHDGLEAMEKIKAHPAIDIVLTDVRMPNADGLELASVLSENYPHIRTVIISGYDDFKYAQQAIHLGVKDYLLKPVDVDELLHVIQRLTDDIRTQRIKFQQTELMKVKDAIYHQVFDAPAAMTNQSTLVGNVSVFPFITMVYEYSRVTKQMSLELLQKWKTDWQNKVESVLQRNGLTVVSLFTKRNRLLTCIVNPPKGLSPKDMVAEISADSAFLILSVWNETTIQVKGLSAIYQTLVHDRRYLPFSTQGYVISPVKETLRPEQSSYPAKIESDLIQAIFQLQGAKVKERIELLFAYLERERLFLDEAVQVCDDILRNAVRHYNSLFRNDHFPAELYFSKTVDDYSYRLIREWFEANLGRIMLQLELKQSNSKDWLIERAEKYIKQYYQEQIKAHEVADVINISPNYFSTLFKQKTGKSFNEYVNHLRVEAAKQLLEETPFNVSEIAEKVGYREYKYFVDVFKKQTGYTPTHYRKLTSS